jgi:O-antigen biosynthesis protein
MIDKSRPVRVSVIVLTYNSADYIEKCLQSLAESRRLPEEIIIADNASADGTIPLTRQIASESSLAIQIVELGRNLGCAGGNNAGVRNSTGEVLIFLNPDTEVTPSLIGELIDPILQDPKTAVTGAKIYYPGTRKLQHAGGFIHPNGMTEHFGAGEEDIGQFDEQREVHYVTGAGFAVRRDVFQELGGFDEDYFPAYFEETDLCMRARKAGYRVLYVPSAVLYHHESVSLQAHSPAFLRLYYRMRIRFCLKNFGPRYFFRHWLPFEWYWMRRSPEYRGSRKMQLRAYREGLTWLIRKKLGLGKNV